MKFFILVFAAFIFAVSLHAETLSERQRRMGAEMVDKQKNSDAARKNEIIRKMKSYMSDVNSRLAKESGINFQLDQPVKNENIDDVKSQEMIHGAGDYAKKVYAYALSDDISVYDEPGSGKVVFYSTFSQMVEVVLRTETYDNGKISDWLMIRTESGDEGWVDSRNFSSKKPAAKISSADIKKRQPSHSAFNVPVVGMRTSNFGYRVHPLTKKSGSFHSGIDIAAKLGTPVFASADGTVAVAEYKKNGYGNLIVLRHDADFATYYGHLSKIRVSKGLSVKKGAFIGDVGSTGASTGPHLHFEIRKSDKALDPDSFMK